MAKKFLTQAEILGRKKTGQAIKKYWQTPEYRNKLVNKQKELGYRSYPNLWPQS